MTVQQQVAERVVGMSDEGATLIQKILDSMSSTFFTQTEEPARVDVKKRFGAGKGIIGNTDDFDRYNDEIAAEFEEMTP